MEKLSDVLSSVKERVTNPFLVSFAIFWCTYNWRIPVALISWDMQQIYATGSNSIFEFVQKELAVEGTFWIPFGYAAAYALLAPFVFSCISIVGGWAIKFGNKFILKNSTTTPINFDKFMALKTKHKKTTDQYSKLLTSESDTQKQLEKTTKDYNDALERNVQIQKEHEITLTRVASESSLRIAAMQSEADSFGKRALKLNEELSKLKEIDETIYSVWKMTRYDDSVVYIEFTNVYPSQIEPSFLARTSPSVVDTYFVLDATIRKDHRLVVASKIFPDNKPTDYFYLFSQNPNSNVWAGYENTDVIKSFERLPDSDFHVKDLR